MVIYPAIDIKDGKCVRLIQGRFDDATVYSDNPVDIALKWEKMGAEYLHVVDLDGARTGEIKNLEIIREMAYKLQIPLQTGGGIRTMETIQKVLNIGVRRVILGTAAVSNRKLVEEAVNLYGSRVAIGIDARDGKVAIEGWEKTSQLNSVDFAKKMQDIGVKTIIYTDISRDGMLKGPNLKAMEEMAKELDIEVIASGGVGSPKDVDDLKKTGVDGVIIGKALYTGAVDLREILKRNKDGI
ncbi:MAG TPA: 1-(5-phosphoribosyl)-5-[(5-phosphoribosylamino)methylideneamino]imidazole-4-carboxamide isomerase [Clostridiaceae bacterium]|nr:1-(5-phosphoribosyl)-5-[(5-phosphoribosylamino)methylideneamino]imidazole-4-carboxamide isomerase [Clostridiaceae bacterium]